jgi:hypothetical protein
VPAPKRRRLARIPLAKRQDVTRGEYNALVELLNTRAELIDDHRRALDIQFKRMAQIQDEVDQLRAAFAKAKRR